MRPARYLGIGLVLLTLAGSACVAGPRRVAAAPALAANSWAARYTAATTASTDATGNTWAAATGLSGGSTQVRRLAIAGTASSQLYQNERLGVTSWSIQVPEPGRYSLDLLFADLVGTKAGQNVFDITATDGVSTTPVVSSLDLATAAGFARTHHVTGLVNLSRTTLTLNFRPKAGQASVNGLRISADGAAGALSTTLNQTFDGAKGARPDTSVWQAQHGTLFGGANSLQGYSTSPAYSGLDGNGNLAITASKTPYSDAQGETAAWTSARLVTKGNFTFGYGHVEASIKAPPGSGMWPAFWALGADEDTVGWPQCGEIDVFEGLGRDPYAIASFIHMVGGTADPAIPGKSITNGSMGVTWHSGIDTTAGFHTYGIDYQPGAIAYSVDGHPFYVVTAEDRAKGQLWPFDSRKFYLILDLAVGNFDWTGSPDSSTPTTDTMLVNRVTVQG